MHYRRATTLLTLILLGAGTLQAQTVKGTLLREQDGRALAGGTVTLVAEGGATVDSTRSAADGGFTLRATSPGTYTLYFLHAGYASVPSDTFSLRRGQTVARRFVVPLISGAAMQRMGQVVDLEKRLQGNITELCGERPRAGTGLLVGTVTDAHTKKPLAGALVRVLAHPPGGAAPGAEGRAPFRRATVTSANGVYVICNVPTGRASMRVELRGYRPDSGPVDAHAGDVGWYDIALKRSGGG